MCSCALFLPKPIYKYAKARVSEEQSKVYLEMLDSSNVFYRTWYVSLPSTQENRLSYQCLRFLPNGHLQIASFFDSIPTLKKIQETFSNYADYYKIEKGVLKLEIYRGGLASMAYWKGTIYPDSLGFHYVNAKFKIPEVYIKTKIR